MRQIKDLGLYVGRKEEYYTAKSQGMATICAINKSNHYRSYSNFAQSGLYVYDLDDLYLNMADTDDPKYISDEMINEALSFISETLSEGREIFVYCSLGQSRSPSIALMYLLENGLIDKKNALRDFKFLIYPEFSPKRGNLLYIKRRYNL